MEKTIVSNLNLDGNYSSEALSYYLWGDKTPPNPEDIVDNKWIDRKKRLHYK